MNPLFLVIGFLLFLIIMLNPFLGLLATVVLLPQALVQAMSESLFGLLTMATPIKILGGITFLSALFHTVFRGKKVLFFKFRQITWYSLFFVWILISGFSMPCFATRENFTQFISFGILGFILFALINNIRQFRIVIWTFLVSVTIISLGTVFSWNVNGSRVGGTAYGANEFAIELLPCLALAFCNIFAERKKYLKTILAIISIILFLTLVNTLSRGGMIGLAGMLLISLLSANKKIKTFIFLSLLVLVIVNVTPQQFWDRFSKTKVVDTYTGDEAIDSASRRYYLAQAGWRIFLEHPIRGIGIGNYYYECRNYAPVIAGRAHNMYLEMMAELGTIGILLFAGIIFYTFKSLLKLMKGQYPYNAYARGFYLGLWGFLIAGIFLHAEQDKILWFVIFMVPALANIASPNVRRVNNVKAK